MSDKKQPTDEEETSIEDNKDSIAKAAENWSPPTWTDQFMKFIADLSGVTNDNKKNN